MAVRFILEFDDALENLRKGLLGGVYFSHIDCRKMRKVLRSQSANVHSHANFGEHIDQNSIIDVIEPQARDIVTGTTKPTPKRCTVGSLQTAAQLLLLRYV